MTPGELFQKLLQENNLQVTLQRQEVRRVEDGSLIIENPRLLVDWLIQPAQQPTVATDPVVPAAEPAIEQPTEQPIQIPTPEEVVPTGEEATNEPQPIA